MFAGAFLLPRNAMLREFCSVRMKHLEGMKERWRVSMQAIAHRAKQIGIIDENQYILFRKQSSFNRWNKNEPLVSTLGPRRVLHSISCKSPEMARNGPQAMSAIWSLIGGKRTSRGQPISVAI
jgi:Zn-dependent peptidase ImmA (M78 family)